jgi:phosphatidylglycerol---prolipoprotein diacylglyceryl transferase
MPTPAYLSIDGHRYWVDRLSPWLIHFSGHFGIRWYGLAYLTGFLLAAWILSRWSRQERLPIPQDEVFPFIFYAALGVMIGGRLGYCFLYNALQVIHHPLVIFEVWQGGMASHGGIAGMVIAVCIYARQQHVRALPLVDAAAATGPLGIMLGRMANFINGELWGRPTHVPWAVIYPNAPLVDGHQVPRHPSQLYAAAIEGVLVFLVGQWVYRRSSRPGSTTAAVCAAYGIGRFMDEFWREPDLGQPVFWGWMSKGQLFSIPMIVGGIAALVWFAVQASPARPETEHQTDPA